MTTRVPRAARFAQIFTISLLALGSSRCAAPVLAPTPAPLAASAAAVATVSAPAKVQAPRPKVIVFVWDGLRPDSISEQTTPNLARLRDHDGTNFTDQHAAYPTFTMMNAAAFATGAYPGRHGFYGNTEYQPGPTGNNAEGKPIDFTQPVFTEDHGVLQALDTFDRARGGHGLFAVDTLFQAAHAAGLRTAAIGKIGPAFLQDYRPSDELSVILDENLALPLGFARALQGAGYPLPVNVVHYPFADGQTLFLAPNNGKPSAPSAERLVKLADGVTPDPRSTLGSAHDAANEYLMRTYLGYVLPQFAPDLSLVWLRNPDSTEHQFGPGSANYLDALRDQDTLLGELLARLTELGLRESTDLFVVSDHGHSTVAGDPAIFPLRALRGEPDGHGQVGNLDAQGYAVSGEVRSADLLVRAGFPHVYDGGGCLLDPVLSGIRKDGSLVYPTRDDAGGKCAIAPHTLPTAKKKPVASHFSMPEFRAPEVLPDDAIVIAANGGTEFFYVPQHARALVEKLVRALQERRVYGAIFVRSLYGAIPGTLPLSAIHAESERGSPPEPDLMVSFDWNDSALVGGEQGLPGTEYASAQRYRGMHGSFSPRDVHNSLIGYGPHIKAGFSDSFPSANVDLPATVAALLGLHFDAPDGRVLSEALIGDTASYRVDAVEQLSDVVRLSKTCRADDPSCARSAGPGSYQVVLSKKVLSVAGRKYSYFDRARAQR